MSVRSLSLKLNASLLCYSESRQHMDGASSHAFFNGIDVFSLYSLPVSAPWVVTCRNKGLAQRMERVRTC